MVAVLVQGSGGVVWASYADYQTLSESERSRVEVLAVARSLDVVAYLEGRRSAPRRRYGLEERVSLALRLFSGGAA